ncbi:hypothetical protein R1sor_003174 [Riccia sorocarpa]|uniref:DDE Tnp4 domain-containing protein n=1 Tax=Riccia sorocarpa TaxID=122646 RepID=A0ABD3H3I9_9MARC
MITAAEKWKKTQDQLASNGVFADVSQIRSKWERLTSDFKKVGDHNKQSGNEPYSSLTAKERRDNHLPANFPEDIFDAIDMWMHRRHSLTPDSTEDEALVEQPPAPAQAGRSLPPDATGISNSETLPLDRCLLIGVLSAVQTMIEFYEDEEDLLSEGPIKRCKKGQWWMKERSLVWYDYFLVHSYEDDRWKKVMHMPKMTFDFIVSRLSSRVARQDTKYKKAVPPDVRVGAVIHRLVTGHNYFHVGDRFGIGESTVQELMQEGVEAIIGELGPEYLRWPSDSEMVRVSNGFQLRSGLPNVQGAVDCTFIRIRAPPGKEIAFDYYNRKGFEFHSIVLQAITDTDGSFLDISCGMPGSTNDKSVLRNSLFFSKVNRAEILNHPVVHINGGFALKPYILGDGGYTMCSWLMMPYSYGPRTTDLQKHYTDRQVQGRICVKRAFGM